VHHGRAGHHHSGRRDQPGARPVAGEHGPEQCQAQWRRADHGPDHRGVGVPQRAEQQQVERDQPGRGERDQHGEVAPAGPDRRAPAPPDERDEQDEHPGGQRVPGRLPGQRRIVQDQPAD
jgi:hypothetical protein